MLIRVWQALSGYNKGLRVEKHKYSDGSTHYSLVDKFGTHNATAKEAEKTIRFEQMEDVTEKYIAAGWISK